MRAVVDQVLEIWNPRHLSLSDGFVTGLTIAALDQAGGNEKPYFAAQVPFMNLCHDSAKGSGKH